LIGFFAVYSFLSYFSVIYINNINVNSYTKSLLALEVFTYSLVFVIAYNFISYFYTGNFFVFSESDAMGYHKYASIMVNKSSMAEALDYYLSEWELSDLGMVMLLYPLYHIVESNLILNLFYIFMGVITSLSLFRLAQNFMSKKYAFIASIAYSLSSFVLFFHSIGLKESFLLSIVVLSFDFYYRFMDNKKIINFILFILFIGLFFFFRPTILAMILVSIGLGFILSLKGGGLLLIILIGGTSPFLMSITEQYTTGGIDTLIAARETQGMIIGGVPFTYAVNILAQSIGPLPSLLSDAAIHTFYGAGLIYRVLLGFPFWLGIIYIYKTKSYKLYPLTIFIIMEMSSLIFIMDGFELRITLPHIPFVFVIAFWFLDKYDRKIIQFKNKKRFKTFFNSSMFLFTLMIFYWNFR